MLSLSPGERAGVRVSVNTNSTENIENQPKSFSLIEIVRSAFISCHEGNS